MSGRSHVMNDDRGACFGLAGRAGSGVLAVPWLADRPPLVREVPIEVNLVAVVPILTCDAIGVHRVDQPQLDALVDCTLPQFVDNLDTGVLVAVDGADHEHFAAAGYAHPLGNDCSTLDRCTDDDAGCDDFDLVAAVGGCVDGGSATDSGVGRRRKRIGLAGQSGGGDADEDERTEQCSAVPLIATVMARVGSDGIRHGGHVFTLSRISSTVEAAASRYPSAATAKTAVVCASTCSAVRSPPGSSTMKGTASLVCFSSTRAQVAAMPV